MKKLILTSTILILTQINIVKGQCIADAGPDKIVCSDWNGFDTVQIGGNPTATGGVPPYTYIWETEWQVGSWTYTASDFLNDTTIANPTIISSFENLTFNLTVIDSESNICTDSVDVDFSVFGTNLMYVTYEIQQGDSIYLTGFTNLYGGFPPVDYLWRPNHGLTDSTSLSFWAKPDTSVAYYLTATDFHGCSATAAPAYFVNVLPVSIESQELIRPNVNVFPNPTKNKITIKIEENKANKKTLDFYDNKGQLVLTKDFHENIIHLETESLLKGLYLYKITESGKLIGQGKIIIE
jgi:hypothetical protein